MAKDYGPPLSTVGYPQTISHVYVSSIQIWLFFFIYQFKVMTITNIIIFLYNTFNFF